MLGFLAFLAAFLRFLGLGFLVYFLKVSSGIGVLFSEDWRLEPSPAFRALALPALVRTLGSKPGHNDGPHMGDAVYVSACHLEHWLLGVVLMAPVALSKWHFVGRLQ